jgi:hypothetical protein
MTRRVQASHRKKALRKRRFALRQRCGRVRMEDGRRRKDFRGMCACLLRNAEP